MKEEISLTGHVIFSEFISIMHTYAHRDPLHNPEANISVLEGKICNTWPNLQLQAATAALEHPKDSSPLNVNILQYYRHGGGGAEGNWMNSYPTLSNQCPRQQILHWMASKGCIPEPAHSRPMGGWGERMSEKEVSEQ